MLSTEEKQELKQKIQANKHEIYVVSIEEMDAIVRSSAKGRFPHIQKSWQKIKNKAETGAHYTASADDLRTLSKLVGDLGGFATKAYVKTYNGKPHIILKGHAGLRTVLTGTKYGIKNPKVVTMGLGKAGAIHAAKTGGILSIVLLSAYRVIDYFLTDQVTLSQLIGSLATDVVKVGIVTGAAIAVASGLVAAGFTVAIGPIFAVVFIGFVGSMVLSAIDIRYSITKTVIAGLDEMGDDINAYHKQIKKDAEKTANEAIDSVIDYAIESAQRVFINMARHHINKFLSRQPKVF